VLQRALSSSSLLGIHGVGVVLTAKLLGQIGDIRRFPTADQLASYTGTAPVDSSSGNRVRRRINTGGNRHLKAVPHTVAVCRGRDSGPGRIYHQRKIAGGKTPPEARRALKRRLTKVIYRPIIKDQRTATHLVHLAHRGASRSTTCTTVRLAHMGGTIWRSDSSAGASARAIRG
jgi:transposase